MSVAFGPKQRERWWTERKGVRGDLAGAILAAGLGQRMDPLTAHHIPKPLFPLGGKVPMAEVWVKRFIESGITDISMNLCVLADTIKRHFGDGSKFGAPINYVEEETPSGTLGGLCKQALSFGGSTVVVPSGDIVTNFGAELLEEMHEIHKRTGSAFTIVVVPVDWDRRKDYGTVVFDSPQLRDSVVSKTGRIKEFIEKDPNSPSNLNNASIYMIETELIRVLDGLRTPVDPRSPDAFYDFGKHVFPAMLGKLDYISLPTNYPLWGVQYDGSWFDVGQKRDYLRVNEQVLDGQLDVGLPYEQLPWGFLGTNVSIRFSEVTIVPPVVIGNDCVIAPGATIGPYAVIGDGWNIESGTSVRNSVLWERYSYWTEDGREINSQDRRYIDQHQIRRGVTVSESIVAGGAIDEDIHEKTVDVLEDGELKVLSIDYVPSQPRA